MCWSIKLKFDLLPTIRSGHRKDDLPGFGTSAVLVRVKAAGVCHSDVHLWHGYYQVGKKEKDRLLFSERLKCYPIVPGHETSGVVHALGGSALTESNLAKGDRVVIYSWVGCNNCPHCSAGEYRLCPYSQELGFKNDGGWAEYVLVSHYRYLVKLPDEVPFEVGALLGCGGITALSAVKKCTGTAARASKWQEEVVYVMVIGLGGVGRWALKLLPLVLKGQYNLHIIAVDISREKLQEAREDCSNIGDTFMLLLGEAPQEMSERYAKESHHKPNIILDFVNSTETFSFGAAILGRAGVAVMVGLHGGVGEVVLPMAVLREVSHVGSYLGSLQDLRELLELVGQHQVEPPHIEKFTFQEARQALKNLEEGRVDGRAVVVMD